MQLTPGLDQVAANLVDVLVGQEAWEGIHSSLFVVFGSRWLDVAGGSSMVRAKYSNLSDSCR